jgi:hypothetical protein
MHEVEKKLGVTNVSITDSSLEEILRMMKRRRR